MNCFLLSKNTVIDGDASIIRKDLDRVVTGFGEKNLLRIEQVPAMEPESFQITVQMNEIVLRYGDNLGRIYGLFHMSEKFLNVPAFAYWNDFQAAEQDVVYIPVGEYQSKPQKVRYRGWFVNDEVLLDGWKEGREAQLTMWETIFETILRAGGNMVIAGTDRGTDELNELASDMGLMVTHHHAELLGAKMFSRVYPDLRASYTQYPELFEGLWRDAVQKMRGRKVIWAVGFRGQGDRAFWDEEPEVDTDTDRGAYIVKVIKKQMEIVRELDPEAQFCTNLYGEMMGLYQQGLLPVPKEVIKVWADNGYGKMVSRRQGNDNPRVPSMPIQDTGALNGIYYHASFYDLQAANHITMAQNSPGFIANELQTVLKNGGNSYWIINSGSIKPHIYILDLIRVMWRDGQADVDAHARSYGKLYYGNEKVGPLLTDFSKNALQYGLNEDDKAADQYYHYPLRSMIVGLMKNETEKTMESLWWAEGKVSLFEQAKGMGLKCEKAVPGWENYLRECENLSLGEQGKQLLKDTLVLQATLHLTGCQALRDFYYALEALKTGKPEKAFLYIHRALKAHKEGLQAMRDAEHGEFANIYRNDCFTNVAFTVRDLTTLRACIRMIHDGDWQYKWHWQYLMTPAQRNVKVLLYRQNQLDDEELAQRLNEVVALKQ